jgi:hypothetical protein
MWVTSVEKEIIVSVLTSMKIVNVTGFWQQYELGQEVEVHVGTSWTGGIAGKGWGMKMVGWVGVQQKALFEEIFRSMNFLENYG